MRSIIIACALLLLYAVQVQATTFTLTVSTSGPNSASVVFSSNPATGVMCGSSSTACSASFASGSTVTLAEIVDSTSVFAGWSGTGGCNSNLAVCPVLMTANLGVTAQFNPTLSLSLFGNGGGTVTDATNTITCSLIGSCAAGAVNTVSYYPNTLVTLIASSSTTGTTFTGWSGGTCSGTASTCSFTMTGHKVVIATFTSVGPFTIVVSTGGPGPGYITSTPAGISCGSTSTACSAVFAVNTSITLTATPLPGHAFVGWGNAGCSGTGTCVIVSTSAQQSTGGTQSPSAWFY